MADKNSQNNGKRHSEKLQVISGGGLKIVNTDAALLELLFDQLDASEPQISVHGFLRSAIDGLRADMLENGCVNSPPAYVEELLGGICWADAPSDAKACGLGLLKLVGGVSQSMAMAGVNLSVRRIRVIEMMFDVARGYIDGLRYAEDGRKIISTPNFENRFGVRVDVKFRKAMLSGEPWDLTDIRDEELARMLFDLKDKKGRRRKPAGK